MRKKYESDISRAQFAKILPLLEKNRKKTRPRTVDLYEIFCAILYVLKTACQWRMIPHDFPKWRTVYFYFQQWNEPAKDGISLLARILKKSGITGAAKIRKEGKDQLLYY